MKVFKNSMQLPYPRPGGGMGWRDVQAGTVPEAYGLSPDDPAVAPYLVDDECAALDEPVVKKGGEPVDLMETQEMAAELLRRGDNPPDRLNKKQLAARLTKLRAAQGGDTDE